MDIDRITFSTYFYELSLHVGSKTVLNKASGLIEAGKVTAVMGASGSGNFQCHKVRPRFFN